MAILESDTETVSSEIDATFYQSADAFFPQQLPFALTFDDVTLASRYSTLTPRNIRLETAISKSLTLQIPIISSDMDTVTESRMAIAMAQQGGLGLIHYNLPFEKQVKEVARVKNHIHGLIQEPISITPDQYIGDVLRLIKEKQYEFHTFPVVEDNGLFVGLLSGLVVKERYSGKKVHEAMTPRDQVFSIQEEDIAGDPIGVADNFFNKHMGIHKLIVVDNKNHLRGLFTISDVERIIQEAQSNRKPARDSEFRLVCGAAISAARTSTDELDRDRIVDQVGNLVDEGLDTVAISTAHGHSQGVGEVVKTIRNVFKDLTIIAGNVTSAEGVAFLADAGADAIKIGQGPGSICTTRIVTGVGIPQLTALYIASCEAAKKGVTILADGGITKSGDIVKALTLADAVICGSLLAGCHEAPGKIMEINGKIYKQYRGMGSLEAMKAGSAARYGHSESEPMNKVAAEGVEALKEVSGSVDEWMSQIVGGVQSGMGYLGAANITELKQRARYIKVSPAAQREAATHDVEVIEVKATTRDSS